MEKRIRRLLDSDWVFAVGGAAIALLLLYKLPMGMADVDEAFYLSIPFRLLKGDSLLTGEWHVSQLSGFLLAPLMALYRFFRSDMEGVVLAFRGFWLAAHLGVMCAGYLLMRGRGKLPAAAASWIYGLFCPFGIMALNYNSMGLASAYLLSILFFMGYDSRAADVAKGVLLAALVLCNPYCLIIYALIMLAAMLCRLLRLKGQLELRHIAFMHAGILVLLIPFAMHVLGGADSLQQIASSLKWILSDPEHPSRSFIGYTRQCLALVVDDRVTFFLIYVILLLFGFPIRPLRPVALAGIAIWCGYNVLWDARWQTYGWGMNSTAFYFYFVGAAAFLFDEQRKLREGACAVFLPLVYALCMNMASNQQFHVMAFAALPGTCLGVVMLCRYAKRHAFGGQDLRVPYLSLIAAAGIAAQLLASGYVRIHHVFWEYPKDNPLTARIEQGPLRGIRTRPENKEKYDALYQAAAELGDVRDQQILFYPTVPSGYLMADCRVAAPSAWMTYLNPEDPRLLAYYDLNPEKQPDIVFVDRRAFMTWKEAEYEQYAAAHGYRIERLDAQFAVLRR